MREEKGKYNSKEEFGEKEGKLKDIMEIKKGIVILPIEKWEEIERDLEDLEMYRSENFAKEIAKRRKGKKEIPLEKVLKKYKI